MTYTIKINDLTTFPLSEWDTVSFDCDYTVTVLSSDINAVKTAFTDIKKIEVFQNHIPIAEYTYFDGFSSITLLPAIFVPEESNFIDGLKVTLAKMDILQQVQNIEDKLNNNVDIASMTADEYKTYLLQKVSEACQEDIYAGDFIKVSNGMKKFTYKLEDQQNLANAMTIVTQGGDSLIGIPYHASGEACSLFPVEDIINIYFALQIRLTQKQTYCNMLNMHIKELQTKEELLECSYGMDLPENLQKQMDDIMAASLTIMETLKSQYQIAEPPSVIPEETPTTTTK